VSDSLKERFRPEDPYARITGMVLVLGGLAVFLVVFFSAAAHRDRPGRAACRLLLGCRGADCRGKANRG
jgi:hypothetical protein